MGQSLRVVIDLLRGEAWLGGTAVGVADVGPRGELQVGGPEGPVLRPLTFGERTRAVSRAASSSRPTESVCAAVLRVATVQPGVADRTIQEILALALAGAGQGEAPRFTEAALLVARGAGWDFAQLADAEAVEVDRLAIHLGGGQHGPRWNRFLLASDPADELQLIRAALANDLLRRADAPRHAAEAEEDPLRSFERPTDGPNPEAVRLWNVGTAASPGGAVAGAVAPSAYPGSRAGSDREADPPKEETQRASSPGPEIPSSQERTRRASRFGHDRPAYVGTGSRIKLRAGSEPAAATPPATPKPEPAAFSTPADPHSEPTRHLPLNSAGAPSPAPMAGWGSPAAEGPWLRPGSTLTAFDIDVVTPLQSAVADRGVPGAEALPELEQSRLATRLFSAPSSPWRSRESLPLIGGDDALSDLADALAALLHHEADMRGIER